VVWFVVIENTLDTITHEDSVVFKASLSLSLSYHPASLSISRNLITYLEHLVSLPICRRLFLCPEHTVSFPIFGTLNTCPEHLVTGKQAPKHGGETRCPDM
jgi:hypothetical protein